jgi:hypothetical protein
LNSRIAVEESARAWRYAAMPPRLSRCFLPAVAIAVLLAAPPLLRAEEPPPLLPTRDVDITYKVTRARARPISERVRWSAAAHLERIDGPNRSTSIFDRQAKEVTLLNGATRTYTKLEGTPRRPSEPDKDAVLKSGGEVVVARQRCVEWSWTEDVETHTICVTPDGMLLRLVVGGETVMEARSVRYRPQPPELFRVPTNYAPALGH